MANQLKVAVVHAIIRLLEQHWPYRRIARELGVDRETVARYDRLRQSADSKPANPTPGSDPGSHPKPANVTPGCLGYEVPDRSLGPPSRCQPFEAVIKEKLGQSLSGQRIWQDLTDTIADTSCCVGITGNVDADPDELIDIGDLTAMIDYLFITFTEPKCMPEANTDGDPDGEVDIADLTALIDYMFITFEEPAECQ